MKALPFRRIYTCAVLAAVLGASLPYAAAACLHGPPLLSAAQIRASADREPSFIEPAVASASQQILYVSDYYTNKVEMFALSGTSHKRVGHLGYRSGIFGPADLFVDAQRNLWVANEITGLSYLSEYAPGALQPERVLRLVGGDYFTSVFVAPDGTVYAGTTSYYVAAFKPGARFPTIHAFQNTDSVPAVTGDSAGNVYALTFSAQAAGVVFKYIAADKRWRKTPVVVGQPGGIALDASGNIVVSDPQLGTGKIDTFSSATFKQTASFPCRVSCVDLVFDATGVNLWYLQPYISGPPATGMFEFAYPSGTFEEFVRIRAKKQNPEPFGIALSPAMPLAPAPPAGARGPAVTIPPAAQLTRPLPAIAPASGRPEADFVDVTSRPRVYVGDVSRGEVIVYGGAPPYSRIGTYRHIGFPAGLAVDRAGDLYISDPADSIIYEFPPGSKTASRILLDPNELPSGVNADGPHGDVVVADICVGAVMICTGSGDVAIYRAGATAPATRLSDARLPSPFYAVYDDRGNIDVDGVSAQTTPVVGTFAAGTYAFTPWTITSPFAYPGGIAIAPHGDIAVVDQGNGTRRAESRLRIFSRVTHEQKRVLKLALTGDDVIAAAFANGGASVFGVAYVGGIAPQYAYPSGSLLGTVNDLTGLPYSIAVSPEVAL